MTFGSPRNAKRALLGEGDMGNESLAAVDAARSESALPAPVGAVALLRNERPNGGVWARRKLAPVTDGHEKFPVKGDDAEPETRGALKEKR